MKNHKYCLRLIYLIISVFKFIGYIKTILQKFTNCKTNNDYCVTIKLTLNVAFQLTNSIPLTSKTKLHKILRKPKYREFINAFFQYDEKISLHPYPLLTN